MVSLNLKKSLASCLLLNTIFHPHLVTAQNVKTPALADADLNQDYQKDFLTLTFTDAENIEEEIALIYGWTTNLPGVEEWSSYAEFSPIQATLSPPALSQQSHLDTPDKSTDPSHQISDIPSEYGKPENIGMVELTSEQKHDWNQAQQDSVTPESSNSEVDDVLNQLDALPQQRFPVRVDTGYRSSPGFTISNPNGYGGDNNTIFIAADYQRRTRFTKKSDGELGFGIAVGNSVKAVGVEFAYTINSFGTSRSEFGSGAFSIKVHRRIAEDMAVAVGWNQFARIERNPDAPLDYPKNSYYGVLTKVFKTQKFIDEPFSRVAITVGIGGGQFLNFDRINEAFINDEAPTGLNVFGSVGVRVLRPVSMIVEWTGQDLGAGLSIVPFKNIPLVITPAIRDISGAGDGARFIMGTGISVRL